MFNNKSRTDKQVGTPRPLDWPLLRYQKNYLINMASKGQRLTDEIEVLDGIISLIDGLQDEAVENGQATIEVVFGDSITNANDAKDASKSFDEEIESPDAISKQPNNRDVRWSRDVDIAIANKVEQAMTFPPRLELGRFKNKTPYSESERKAVLTVSFREIVKATSLDTLTLAPPALLEQLSVLAVLNNENVKGILVQVIRIYMLLWGTPETNDSARRLLLDMEKFALEKLFSGSILKPERLKWGKMPG